MEKKTTTTKNKTGGKGMLGNSFDNCKFFFSTKSTAGLQQLVYQRLQVSEITFAASSFKTFSSFPLSPCKLWAPIAFCAEVPQGNIMDLLEQVERSVGEDAQRAGAPLL